MRPICRTWTRPYSPLDMLVLRLVAIRNLFLYMKRMIYIITFFPLKPQNVRRSGGCLKNDRSRDRLWSKGNHYEPAWHHKHVFANGKAKQGGYLKWRFNFLSRSSSGTNVFMASTSWRWSSAEMWNGFYGWGKQVMVKSWTLLYLYWQLARTVRQTPENRPRRRHTSAYYHEKIALPFIIVSIPVF